MCLLDIDIIYRHWSMLIFTSTSTSNFIGILTKTDITKAFSLETPPETEAESFLNDSLICVKVDTQTDDIADLIQKKFVHHLVVVDEHGIFAGVASSWDVAREVSLDAKAFPYNRELWTKTTEVPLVQ